MSYTDPKEFFYRRDDWCQVRDIKNQPSEIDLGQIEDVPIAMFVAQED